jgi:hypothetical protein
MKYFRLLLDFCLFVFTVWMTNITRVQNKSDYFFVSITLLLMQLVNNLILLVHTFYILFDIIYS